MAFWRNGLVLVLLAFAVSRASGQEERQGCPPTDVDPSKAPSANAEVAETVAAQIEAGKVARAACDLEKAIAAFSEALRVAPNAQVYALRGRVHAEHGDDQQAWADFKRAIELDPKQAEAFAGRGWLHAMRGEYDPAVVDSTEAIRLDPKCVDAYVDRAFVYQSTERQGLADADIRTAQEINSKALEFCLPKGVQWSDPRPDARQIVARCDEALKINDRNFTAYLNRGFAHYLLAQHEKSIEDYTAALQINPTYSQGYNYRGLSHFALNNLARAIVDFSASIHFDPTFKWPYVNRAASWVSLGHSDHALEDLDKAIEIDPQFKHALRNRLGIHVNDHRFDVAILDANSLIAIQPEEWKFSLPAYAYRARCWLGRGDYEASIRDLDVIIRRMPNEAMYYAWRAWVYFLWDKLEQAVADDAAARQIDPRFGRDYRALADARRNAKKDISPPTELPAVGAAEAAIAEAIREYRVHPETEDWPARVVVDKRLTDGAGRLPVRYLEKLLRSAPDDRETGMAVANCLGLGYPDDPPLTVAKLLVELLDSPEGRVRYRAADAIARRAEDRSLTAAMANVLASSVWLAQSAEQKPVIAEALANAAEALKEFAKANPQP